MISAACLAPWRPWNCHLPPTGAPSPCWGVHERGQGETRARSLGAFLDKPALGAMGNTPPARRREATWREAGSSADRCAPKRRRRCLQPELQERRLALEDALVPHQAKLPLLCGPGVEDAPPPLQVTLPLHLNPAVEDSPIPVQATSPLRCDLTVQDYPSLLWVSVPPPLGPAAVSPLPLQINFPMCLEPAHAADRLPDRPRQIHDVLAPHPVLPRVLARGRALPAVEDRIARRATWLRERAVPTTLRAEEALEQAALDTLAAHFEGVSDVDWTLMATSRWGSAALRRVQCLMIMRVGCSSVLPA